MHEDNDPLQQHYAQLSTEALLQLHAGGTLGAAAYAALEA